MGRQGNVCGYSDIEKRNIDVIRRFRKLEKDTNLFPNVVQTMKLNALRFDFC